MTLDFRACRRVLAETDFEAGGRLTHVSTATVEAILPRAQTGAIYRIVGRSQHPDLLAEVIGFREQEAILAPFGDPRGVGPGDPVIPEGRTDHQDVGPSYLGRVVDSLGRPLDDGPPVSGRVRIPLYRSPPNPLLRTPISEPIMTGVSVIDSVCTLGRGQRVGIFSGAGVGKSSLMGMLARFCECDVTVIALVGERGREVRSFIERELGPSGLQRSVLVVATGDASPILRVRAAFLATALAEFFRDQGQHTLLVMDSLTRLAQAAREIGLAAGEPPTTRGYPPSVFSILPKLLERAGNSDSKGSLTAVYTVLVDGDDLTEPIADAVRSILDGHLVLSRRIAEAGRYPALDVSGSLSRVASDLAVERHLRIASRVREVFGGYEEVRDLIQVGAYRAGSDPSVDRVIQLFPRLADFFAQGRSERRSLDATLGGLEALLGPDIHATLHA